MSYPATHSDGKTPDLRFLAEEFAEAVDAHRMTRRTGDLIALLVLVVSAALAITALTWAPASATPNPVSYLDKPGSIGSPAYAYHWSPIAGHKCSPITTFKVTETRKIANGAKTSTLTFGGQPDGNAVVRQFVTTRTGSWSQTGWSPGIANRGVTKICVQSDGNVVWRDASGRAIWHLGQEHIKASNYRFQITVWDHCATYKSFRKDGANRYTLLRQVNLTGRAGGPLHPCYYRYQ